jgi:hypothetical protein
MLRIATLTVALLTGFFLVGFSLDNALVPKEEILSGGPPKDGIPAILKPQFIIPDEADFLMDDDPVIGVVIGAVARAYPIRILNWHEVVNDTINGAPLVVTF